MNRAKKLTAVLTVLGICTLSVTGIMGYWKMTGSSGNILTMASFRIRLKRNIGSRRMWIQGRR